MNSRDIATTDIISNSMISLSAQCGGNQLAVTEAVFILDELVVDVKENHLTTSSFRDNSATMIGIGLSNLVPGVVEKRDKLLNVVDDLIELRLSSHVAGMGVKHLPFDHLDITADNVFVSPDNETEFFSSVSNATVKFGGAEGSLGVSMAEFDTDFILVAPESDRLPISKTVSITLFSEFQQQQQILNNKDGISIRIPFDPTMVNGTIYYNDTAKVYVGERLARSEATSRENKNEDRSDECIIALSALLPLL